MISKVTFDTEDALIDALILGDSTAFQYLITTHYNALFRVAVAIVGRESADGVIQDAWISIIKALPKFEKRSTLKTWMTRIVANEAKNRLRKESRQVLLDDMGEDNFLERFKGNGHWQSPPVSWDFSTPEQILEEKQLRYCIEATLKRLPEKQKAVFSLRYMENFSLEEICNILDVNYSNVRVILHRGKNQLFETIQRFQVTGEC